MFIKKLRTEYNGVIGAELERLTKRMEADQGGSDKHNEENQSYFHSIKHLEAAVENSLAIPVLINASFMREHQVNRKRISEALMNAVMSEEDNAISSLRHDMKISSAVANGAEKFDACYLYQNALYGISGNYSDEEKKLLILEFADKERQKFERLAAKFSQEQTEHVKHERTRIPENVRIEVWRRDEGKCAGCGSRVNLEYDHIVPVSRGGSNTARNVELLCEACNRSKGDRIQ